MKKYKCVLEISSIEAENENDARRLFCIFVDGFETDIKVEEVV